MTAARRIGLASLAALIAGACTAAPIDVAGLAPESLSVGLVAHWRLDETAGTLAADSSGNGHDGLVQGGAVWAGGQFAGALQLVPPASVAVGSFPQATRSWSISLWAWVAGDQIATPSFGTILSNAFGPGGWDVAVLNGSAGLSYHFGYWVGPQTLDYVLFDCTCVDLDRWTHVAVVVDGDALTVSMYRDGAFQVSMPVPRTIVPGSPTLFMGRWAQPERYFAGSLDDVSIYRRTLTPEEIALLAKAAAPDPR